MPPRKHTCAQWASEAEKKSGIPGWKWHTMSVRGDLGMAVSGSVPVGTYRSGPRKGQTKWDKKSLTEATILVTYAEMEVVANAYEATTGGCWPCSSTGMVFHSWSDAEGVKMKLCKRCGGSGRLV